MAATTTAEAGTPQCKSAQIQIIRIQIKCRHSDWVTAVAFPPADNTRFLSTAVDGKVLQGLGSFDGPCLCCESTALPLLRSAGGTGDPLGNLGSRAFLTPLPISFCQQCAFLGFMFAPSVSRKPGPDSCVLLRCLSCCSCRQQMRARELASCLLSGLESKEHAKPQEYPNASQGFDQQHLAATL